MGQINDLEIEDLDQILAGEVLYMAIEGKHALQINAQSCNCSRVIIVMRDYTLLAEHRNNGEAGAICFKKMTSFDAKAYNLRISPPPSKKIQYVKTFFAPDGTVDGVKYRYGDYYLSLFASEYELIVTKSICDLFEEDDTSIPEFDPSVLFDEPLQTI